MKARTKVWLAAGVGLLAVVGVLVGIKAGQIFKMIQIGKTFVPPPEAVTTARVETLDWQSYRSAIGTLVAVHGVTLSAELTGQVREIGFDSGAWVKQGAMLVLLDTSVERAQLAAAEADAALAQINLDRARTLRQGEANAPADLDAAEARAKQAAASVANLQATIAKKTIRAPLRRTPRHPPGRARSGRLPRHTGRLSPVGQPHLRGVFAATAGARGR